MGPVGSNSVFLLFCTDSHVLAYRVCVCVCDDVMVNDSIGGGPA